MFSLRQVLFVAFIASGAGCQDKNECDVYPARCPGLIVQIITPSIIQKNAREIVTFSVQYQGEGKSEDPNELHATLLSIKPDVNCRDALNAKNIPQTSWKKISCNERENGLNCNANLTDIDLAPLSLGDVQLCVYGRDIGSTSATIVNKVLKVSSQSAANIDFSGIPATTALSQISPLSISVSNQSVFLLYSGKDSMNRPRRQVAAYSYKPDSIKPAAYIDAVGSNNPFFDTCLASVSKAELLVFCSDPTVTPITYFPSTCALSRPFTGQIPCSWDGSTTKQDGLVALGSEQNRRAFAAATNDKLKGFSLTPSFSQEWEFSRQTGPVRLLFGDLDGPPAGSVKGTDDLMAIWPASGWPDDGAVKVLMGSMERPDYSANLKSAIVKALGSITPIPTNIAALAVGDLDNDNLADIVVGGGTSIRVLFNQGNGQFRLAASPPLDKDEQSLNITTTAPVMDVSIGDVDGVTGNEIVVLTATPTPKLAVYQIR
jgi:hypothetical protein